MIYATGIKHVAKFWLRSPDDIPEIERRVAELATLPEVIDMIVGPPLDTDWVGPARYVLRPGVHRPQLAERIEACYVEYDLARRIRAMILVKQTRDPRKRPRRCPRMLDAPSTT